MYSRYRCHSYSVPHNGPVQKYVCLYSCCQYGLACLRPVYTRSRVFQCCLVSVGPKRAAQRVSSLLEHPRQAQAVGGRRWEYTICSNIRRPQPWASRKCWFRFIYAALFASMITMILGYHCMIHQHIREVTLLHVVDRNYHGGTS